MDGVDILAHHVFDEDLAGARNPVPAGHVQGLAEVGDDVVQAFEGGHRGFAGEEGVDAEQLAETGGANSASQHNAATAKRVWSLVVHQV